MSIEKNFELFIRQQLNGRSHDDIEYLGINFWNDSQCPPVFKCYFSTNESLSTDDPLISDFKDRDMIRALNRITDTAFEGQIRYEIGLKNRYDSNMDWLYRWMGKAFPATPMQAQEMAAMAELSCCASPEYSHSSLYYLGILTSKKNTFPLSAIKLHYILRKCADPDHIGRDYIIDPYMSLDCIASKGIGPMTLLADSVRSLLKTTDNIELWMAAMDFFLNGNTKYKIYIKLLNGDLISPLQKHMEFMGLYEIKTQLTDYLAWIPQHPELKPYGAAVCIDLQGKWSLNLYQSLET